MMRNSCWFPAAIRSVRKKARYYQDPQMKARILLPPSLSARDFSSGLEVRQTASESDWADATLAMPRAAPVEDPANAGIRREPELPEHEEIAPQA